MTSIALLTVAVISLGVCLSNNKKVSTVQNAIICFVGKPLADGFYGSSDPQIKFIGIESIRILLQNINDDLNTQRSDIGDTFSKISN